MNEQLLIIDTSNIDDNPKLQGSYNDVNVNFDIPLVLPNTAKISLAQAVIYYSWPNISSDLSNNTFEMSNNNGVTWFIATIPNGNYTVATLQTTMRTLLFNQFASNGNLTLGSDTSTGKLSITIGVGLSIRLSNQGFRTILGWGNTQNTVVTSTSIGNNLANFMFDRFSYLLHCDMVNETIVNNTSHRQVVHNFSVSLTDQPSGPIIIEPFTKYYLSIKPQSSFRRVRFWLTDNNNNPISTGLPMVLTFHIKY